jgi:hypothetical protein
MYNKIFFNVIYNYDNGDQRIKNIYLRKDINENDLLKLTLKENPRKKYKLIRLHIFTKNDDNDYEPYYLTIKNGNYYTDNFKNI